MTGSAKSQTVLLSVDRATDSLPTQWGPNLKKYSHTFFSAGLIASSGEAGGQIIVGPSTEFAFGLRDKYRVGKVYSLGWDISVNLRIFKLRQDAGKQLPDTLISDVSRMDYGSAILGVFQRFNVDPLRGNTLGKYLDTGVYGEWFYSIHYIRKDRMPDGSRLKQQFTKLPFTRSFSAGVFTRIGLNKISFYGRFRLTSLFLPSFQFPELPALTLGVEAAISR